MDLPDFYVCPSLPSPPPPPGSWDPSSVEGLLEGGVALL